MKNSAPYERNMAVHTNHTKLVTVASKMPTVLLSKGMGAQVAHKGTAILTRTIQTQENAKGQIMLS